MLRGFAARVRQETRVRISPQQQLKLLSVGIGQCWPKSIEVTSGAKVRESTCFEQAEVSMARRGTRCSFNGCFAGACRPL